MGHKASQCLQKESYKNKIPQGYQGNQTNRNNPNELGAFARLNNEFLLQVLEENVKNDDRIWMADTGASIQMITSKKGLVNICDISEEGTVTMGNGNKERFGTMGDLVWQINMGNKRGETPI
jgi:hypothetical protein